jgi:hypothetical protein
VSRDPSDVQGVDVTNTLCEISLLFWSNTRSGRFVSASISSTLI